MCVCVSVCVLHVTRLLLLKGVIVNGCIRDSEDIGRMQLGVKVERIHTIASNILYS